MFLTFAIERTSGTIDPDILNTSIFSSSIPDHAARQLCEHYISTISKSCDSSLSNCTSEVYMTRTCRIMLWRLKMADKNRSNSSPLSYDLDTIIRELEEELNTLRSEHDRQKRNPGRSLSLASKPHITAMPRKVFHFLKEAGYGIGNMESPPFWDDVDGQRGLLIVDVGAFDGSDWSIPAVIKRGHTVLAFEPMPANRERFMQRVRNQKLENKTYLMDISHANSPRPWPLNTDGRIFLFGLCVSDHSGTVQMHSEAELASVHPQNFYPNSDDNDIRGPIEVPAIRLDSIISNQDVHLLKIDTQGHELGVLRGARRLFEEGRINIVAVEFWPNGMAAGGFSAVDVLDFLHGFGFVCFDCSRNGHVPPARPSDFEGFVASFDPGRDEGFGAWDELLCFRLG
jgi:FkbM family methyltransferase